MKARTVDDTGSGATAQLFIFVVSWGMENGRMRGRRILMENCHSSPTKMKSLALILTKTTAYHKHTHQKEGNRNKRIA